MERRRKERKGKERIGKIESRGGWTEEERTRK